MNPANDHTKHLVLMMTYSCNLHCTYCYEMHSKDKRMKVKDAIKYIENCFHEIKDNPWYERLEIIFMGGEPLLEWENIKQIVEIMEEKKDWPLPYHFFSATNGTLLSDEKKEWIIQRKDYFILGISVDGDFEMQNRNRSNSAQSIDLDFFSKTWPKQVPKMTISHESLPYLARGILFLHKKGFDKIQANLAMGQRWMQEDLSVYAEQLSILVDYYIDNPNQSRCSLLNIDLPRSLKLYDNNRKFCGCGEMMVCVDTNGEVYPCQMFAPITLPMDRVNKVKEINFNDHSFFINDKCAKCMLSLICPRCYGMSYKQTGDITFQQPFLCKAFKIQYLSNCKLIEELIKRNPELDKTGEYTATLNFINRYLFN